MLKHGWQQLADELEESRGTRHGGTAQVLDYEAIRSQLKKLLASPRFQASPRCQSLLEYVVEEALAGNSAAIKERTIGVAVFRRQPAYDTSSDPVVRVAAGETRKKLAQYYCEPERADELRITLPIGTYAPEFHPCTPVPQTAPVVAAEPSLLPEPTKLLPSRTVSSITPPETVAAPPHTWLPKLATALSVLSVLFIGGFALLTHYASHEALSQFWAPITRQSSQVLLVVGQLRSTHVTVDTALSRQPDFSSTTNADSNNRIKDTPIVSLEDSTTVANMAVFLREIKKTVIINGATSTSFDDLKRAPTILVGGFNNDWTIRLTRPMRFSFSQDATGAAWWVSDRKDPNKHWGEVQLKTKDPMEVEQDFAIVLRISNSETGQPVIAVSGVTAGGTRAAAEFITT